MNKQFFINRHDMSAEQKRFYLKIETARNEYQELCYQGPLPSVTERKKSRRPGLAIAAGVLALVAVLRVNPFDNRVAVPEAAVSGNDLPQSSPVVMSTIIPKMNKAPVSLSADKPRLSAKRRPSFRAPARPIKDSA